MHLSRKYPATLFIVFCLNLFFISIIYSDGKNSISPVSDGENPNQLYSKKYDIKAKVETIRKDGFITLIFDKEPTEDYYYIVENEKIIGKIKIVSVKKYYYNNLFSFRVYAEYEKSDRKNNLLRAGFVAGLVSKRHGKERDFGEAKYKEKPEYKKDIISMPDARAMRLIPEGKFVFGFEHGDGDEKPEKIVYIDNFYIDKFEVSNKDYIKFVKDSDSMPPLSWGKEIYAHGKDEFPVIVTYYEAISYAEWAGKRLPSEQEWEKAARGAGVERQKKQDETFMLTKKVNVYPWGNKFDPGKVNSLEFWKSAETGKSVKEKYKQGPLPVHFFDGSGNSVYNIVNMAGNVSEWTSSWYRAYSGARQANKRYGRQVKVIRGGSWYNNKYKVRCSDREFGGLPNLYIDNSAGFRCVQDTVITDRIR